MSPADAELKASSLCTSDWRSARAGLFLGRAASFCTTAASVTLIVSLLRSARQTMNAFATALTIPTVRPGSVPFAEKVRMSLSVPPVTLVAVCITDAEPNAPPVRSSAFL